MSTEAEKEVSVEKTESPSKVDVDGSVLYSHISKSVADLHNALYWYFLVSVVVLWFVAMMIMWKVSHNEVASQTTHHQLAGLIRNLTFLIPNSSANTDTAIPIDEPVPPT
jgi:hypothetical protein